MKRYAAIDIGAHAVKLKIVERSQKGHIKTLEDLIHPLMLGNRVYENKRLDPSDIDEIAKTLHQFLRLMQEYKVETYRAVATSVIRSADNGRFAMAILAQRLNIRIEILEEPVERFLTYVALESQLEDYEAKRRDGVLVIEVGSVGSEVILYKDNKLVRNNELQVGTIPLKHMLSQMRRISLYPEQILTDHIYAQTANLQSYLIRQQISHVVMIGADIRRLKALLGLKKEHLSALEFETLKHSLIQGNFEVRNQLEKARLDYDEVLVALLVFDQFVTLTQASSVDMPSVALRDGILTAMFNDIESFERNKLQTKDVISCAKYMAKRHHGTMPHIRQLEKHCIVLFDAFRKQEKFTEIDLLRLRLAAILHETGKFTRQSNYHSATYQSIAHASILGLTQEFMNEVALVTMQSFSFSDLEHFDSAIDQSGTAMKTIKLGLLLALADATDKSKRQSLRLKDAELTDASLTMNFVGEDSPLEEWAIKQLQESFFDVFGRKLIIKVKER